MVLVHENPYYFAALGGLILGLATTLNYVLRGKVTGMSGLLFGLFSWQKKEVPDKIGILGGMIVVAGAFFDIFGYESYNRFTPFGPSDEITKETSYIGFGLAGLLVGFGTKLGNGCTSGHGLCGLSRLSLRSFVAVVVFLSTAIIVATTQKHASLGPFSDQQLNPQLSYNHMVSANLCIAVGVLLPILGGAYKASQDDHQMTGKQVAGDQLISFLVGLLFGLGLLVAGMVRRSNIIGFVGLDKEWNPSLLFVLGVGVLVNLITFNYMIRVKKTSVLGNCLFNPTNSAIDWKLLLGASCFGLGWGMGGLCPGPAIMQLAVFTVPVHVIWLIFLALGMLLARLLEKCTEEPTPEDQDKSKKEIERSASGKTHPEPTDANSPNKNRETAIINVEHIQPSTNLNPPLVHKPSIEEKIKPVIQANSPVKKAREPQQLVLSSKGSNDEFNQSNSGFKSIPEVALNSEERIKGRKLSDQKGSQAS